MKRDEINLKQIKKDRYEKNKTLPIEFLPFSKISPYLTYIFLRFLPFTPNQVSFIWGFIGLFGTFVMSIGGYWNLLIGILLYHFAVLLDYIDGELARYLNKKTIGGPYLDYVFSWVIRSMLMLGLGIGLYNHFGNVIYFYLGILTSMVLLIDNINKLKVYETLISLRNFNLLKELTKDYNADYAQKQKGIIQKTKFYAQRFLTPNGVFSVLFFSIIFNISQYYLILMSILIPLFSIKNFIGIYRKIGNIKSN